MRFLLLFFALLTLTACEDTKKQSEANTPSAVSKKVDTTAKKPEKTQTKDLRFQALPLLTEATADSILRAYGKENPETRAKITTKYGEIEIELFKDTPVHRANFVYLVKEGYFNNTYVHRVVPNFIIQAGNSDNADTNRKRAKIGKYRLSAELENGRKHKRGTISGAKWYRENPDNKSAAYEFFIFLGPEKSTGHLNNKYTIFGQVTKGMDVVDTIANLPADEGEWPLNNVYISIELLD